MDESPPDRSGPPLNLSREAFGYLVIAAGVSAMFLLLRWFPASVPYPRLSRLGAALIVAVFTAYLNRYVTGDWYDQFT